MTAYSVLWFGHLTGLGDDMWPIRRQVITRTNDDSLIGSLQNNCHDSTAVVSCTKPVTTTVLELGWAQNILHHI